MNNVIFLKNIFFSHLILQLLIKYLIFVLGWVKNHGKDRKEA